MSQASTMDREAGAQWVRRCTAVLHAPEPPPAITLSDLTPAEWRALDWLPGDGGWQREAETGAVSAGLKGLFRRDLAICRTALTKRKNIAAFWSATQLGIGLKREQAVQSQRGLEQL